MHEWLPGPGRPVVQDHFHSADADTVEQFIRCTYVDIDMTPVDGRPFQCGHDVVSAPGFSIGQMFLTAVMDATVGPTVGRFVVEHLHDGHQVWDHPVYGEVRTAAGSVVTLPRSAGEFHDRFAELELDIITLEDTALTRYVADVHGLGADALELVALLPVGPEAGRAWAETVRRVRDEILGNPLLIDSPIVLDTAFRTLAAAFLTTFPITGRDDVLRRPRGRVDRARLQEAAEYLRERAGEPVRPGELARLAGMPLVHLGEGMRRAHDTTPAQVLWRARLHGLRRDLQGAEPGAEPARTAAALAVRWGFRHPRSLRAVYCREFGESPEETLLH